MWWSAWLIAARSFLATSPAIEDGGEEPSQYVRYASAGDPSLWPAVTLAVSKRKGANAIEVADRVLARVNSLRGSLLPYDVQLSITRNYGETAAEKSNGLLFHMLIAVISVAALIWLTLGFREAGIVFSAIPVTLALTLATFYLCGFTLNRITLFALIFSIGILVDDAIVVVENIVRHARLPHNQGRSLAQVAIEAVDEVGNPTILATLTVIAAILPNAFVGGLAGPYMRPIPIVGAAAMVFSLIVALVVTPWASVRILGNAAAPHPPRRRGPTHPPLPSRDESVAAQRRCALRILDDGRRPVPRLDRSRRRRLRQDEDAALRQ